MTVERYSKEQEHKAALTELEKSISIHQDVEIKNRERLKKSSEQNHNIAICNVLTSLLKNFKEKKIYAIIEAEIIKQGKYANPEDIVIWIEDLGIFVLEIKSHKIDSIKGFENNIPQIIYNGNISSDTRIIDQPRDFAYKLKAELELNSEKRNIDLPALYFAGWLPNISPKEIRQQISDDKIWLSDMLEKQDFLDRLKKCKNLTRGEGAKRETLEILVNDCFGCSSGLRPLKKQKPRSVTPGSLGYVIAERDNQLKKLTKEQEELINHEYILSGPKVIRGVAGSGKTVVLANIVANKLLDFYDNGSLIKDDQIRLLVLCFNKALVPYLKELIEQCFKQRCRNSTKFPEDALVIKNIDKFAYEAARKYGLHLRLKRDNAEEENIAQLVKNNIYQNYFDHVFIDEGQDIDLTWFDWIKTISRPYQTGPSIIIFYDDAQNLYGQKRPGIGNTRPWNKLLGADINPRGARTIMRVGHRNTNEILTFSFNLLLGSFAPRDPQMATFSDINSYAKEIIPDDPQLGHTNAGKNCIQKIDERKYQINFAINKGPFPKVKIDEDNNNLLNELIKQVKYDIDPTRGNIDPTHILIMTREKEDVANLAKIFESEKIHCHAVLEENKDQYIFQEGKITVSTIHSAKGYSAHICHIVFIDKMVQPEQYNLVDEQRSRAMLHVACTRAMSQLFLWGKNCPLMQEAEEIRVNLENSQKTC